GKLDPPGGKEVKEEESLPSGPLPTSDPDLDVKSSPPRPPFLLVVSPLRDPARFGPARCAKPYRLPRARDHARAHAIPFPRPIQDVMINSSREMGRQFHGSELLHRPVLPGDVRGVRPLVARYLRLPPQPAAPRPAYQARRQIRLLHDQALALVRRPR